MPSSKNKKLIGLTGGFGSGKSTVLKMFQRLGADVFDADAQVQRLLDTAAVKKKIRHEFGLEVFSGAKLDRNKMAEKVFGAPRRLKVLEKILHPLVRRAMRRQAARSRKKVLICDIPLLYEKKWQDKFDGVIVVAASLPTRLRRLRKRGYSKTEALRRIEAQLPLNVKIKKATHVVNNNASLAKTRAAVGEIWKEWQS